MVMGQGTRVRQNIVAACDVDFDRVARQMLKDGQLRPERVELKAAYDKAERFTDYRQMFDKRREQPVFLAPGDSLSFQRIDRKTFDRIARDVDAGTFDWAKLVKT